MNIRKAAAVILTGLAAVGCGQGADAPSGSAASEPLFLFKDPATSGPRLDVYEIDGRASVSLGGPIGTEGRLAGIGGLESLGELYRVVHPDVTEVPAELIALNERVQSERAEVKPSPASELPAPQIEKSESAFKTAACHDFHDSISYYTMLACLWKPSTNYLRVVGIDLNDRVYVWNNNPRTATLEHRLVSGYLWGSATIPAYWWTYATITRDGPYMTATLTPAGGVSGELGLTHHDWSPDVN